MAKKKRKEEEEEEEVETRNIPRTDGVHAIKIIMK